MGPAAFSKNVLASRVELFDFAVSTLRAFDFPKPLGFGKRVDNKRNGLLSTIIACYAIAALRPNQGLHHLVNFVSY
jgi:hypothetical protein